VPRGSDDPQSAQKIPGVSRAPLPYFPCLCRTKQSRQYSQFYFVQFTIKNIYFAV